MSHDSATGEIIEKRDNIVTDWSKTQSSGLVSQLNCGARAFDYRPFYYNSTLHAHHGAFLILKPMQESLIEVINWCNTHQDSLVIIYLSHFAGDEGCRDASIGLLESMNINTMTDCDEIGAITFEDAFSRSTLEGGGHLLGIVECVNEYYDSTINCYGLNYVCYDPISSAKPWAMMTEYALNTTSTLREPGLWMNQVHWQSDAMTDVLGSLHNSSLILDTTRSQINLWVAMQVYSHAWNFINFVEVNEVCDYGLEIYSALQTHYVSKLDLKVALS